jgi:hypothetical protein
MVSLHWWRRFYVIDRHLDVSSLRWPTSLSIVFHFSQKSDHVVQSNRMPRKMFAVTMSSKISSSRSPIWTRMTIRYSWTTTHAWRLLTIHFDWLHPIRESLKKLPAWSLEDIAKNYSESKSSTSRKSSFNVYDQQSLLSEIYSAPWKWTNDSETRRTPSRKHRMSCVILTKQTVVAYDKYSPRSIDISCAMKTNSS